MRRTAIATLAAAVCAMPRQSCRGNIACKSVEPVCGATPAWWDEVVRGRATIENATFRARPWWRTCAVVGSSGILVDAGLGPSIDAADAVFRINDAPIKNFERDVGHKETVRVTFLNTVKDYDGLVVLTTRPKDCRHKLALSASRPYIKERCFTSSKFGGVELALPKEKIITTGMVAVAVAFDVCASVVMYGFDSYDDYRKFAVSHTTPNWQAIAKMPNHTYHYYDASLPGRKRGQDRDSEGTLIVSTVHDVAAETRWRAALFQTSSVCRPMI